MQLKQLAERLNSDFAAHADAAVYAKYSRYFKGGFPGYGLPEGYLDNTVTRLEQEHNFTLKEVLELGDYLFTTGKYECGSLAIRLLISRKDSIDLSVFDALKNWFDNYINNWAHNDYICSEITPVLLKKKIIRLQDFDAWKRSASTFTRRAVPVTLLCLRKAEKPEVLLAYIEDMMLEEVREVHQGLGWLLRELWKLYPAPTEAFLLKHKQHSARLIYQYACEKMSKEQKERFRKEKS
jgi:3-methyladenine DNA glycosylase AlkD